MTERTVIVYTAGRLDEAQLLVLELETVGIRAVVENASLQGASGLLPPGEAIAPRIRVAEEDAVKARQVAIAWEHRQRVTAQGTPDDEPEPPVAYWYEWPGCPACGRHRHTVCPICDTAGDVFPLADASAAVLRGERDRQDLGVMLLCTTCDEPFSPEFYRHCAWCGHDFGSGRVQRPVESSPEIYNPRIWLALGLLVASGAALFVLLFALSGR